MNYTWETAFAAGRAGIPRFWKENKLNSEADKGIADVTNIINPQIDDESKGKREEHYNNWYKILGKTFKNE